MGDVLAEAFRAELPCDGVAAASLASRAREYLSDPSGTPEDADEDLVLRLRDPRTFGSFAETMLNDRGLAAPLRRALLEHVFDLLPLPRTEGDVIEVESRAPPHLLALASTLAEEEGLTVLHVMHIVYAVFLNRSLVTAVPRRTRSAILHTILVQPESGENLRALYAGLHLAAVPEAEAAWELRRLLKTDAVARGLRTSVASLAGSDDGGRSGLTRMAQNEGLLPADLEDPQDPAILANIPRLPGRLSAASQRFLTRADP